MFFYIFLGIIWIISIFILLIGASLQKNTKVSFVEFFIALLFAPFFVLWGFYLFFEEEL